jgi:outer membrane receptor for ferrienterochelin and colicins
MKPNPVPAWRPLAALIASLFSLHAVAAETAAAPLKPAEPPIQKVEITGTAKTYDARRDDTATKMVVTGEEMLRQGDSNIAEALKRLPGVTIGGTPGRANEIRMRGLGNGYTQVLLNGDPLPPGVTIDSIPPESIERIEVMRAATADLSTQAIAGTVNIILKKTIQSAQREVKLAGRYQGGWASGSANLMLADKSGPLAYSLNATLSRDHYRGGRYALETVTDSPAGAPVRMRWLEDFGIAHAKQLVLSPRVVWTIEPGETLSAQSFVTVNRYDGANAQLTTAPVGEPPHYPFRSADFFSHTRSARNEATWSKSLANGGKAELKGSAYLGHYDGASESRNRDMGDKLLLDRRAGYEIEERNYTLNGKFSMPLGDGHNAAFGLEGSSARRHEDRSQRDASPVGEPVQNIDEGFSSKIRRMAVYGQDEWQVTPRWSLYLGLRWEGVQLDSADNAGGSARNTYSVLSPIVQTLWKLPDTKNDQVRFALTRTYKAPPAQLILTRRYRSLDNSISSPDFMGNPQLRPELAWGMDFAYEHYLAQGGLLSASTYVRQIRDLTRTQLSFVDGLWVNSAKNGGTALSRGIELEAKMPLKELWAEAPAIDLRANIARNWSTVSDVPGPNNRLDSQTPVSGTLGLDYKFSDALTMGGSYSFQSGGETRYAADEWSFNGARRTLDLYANWKIDPKRQLRVSVGNALHQEFKNGATYRSGDTLARTQNWQPGFAAVRVNYDMKF